MDKPIKKINQNLEDSRPLKYRWRKIKKLSRKKQKAKHCSHPTNQYNEHKIFRQKVLSIHQTLIETYTFARLKAFITDIFMIYIPILYIMTYLILGSAENFRHNQLGIFICLILYGIISALFISISAQTPGLRYVKLTLICTSGKKVGFIRAFVRFFIWILGSSILLGFLTPFFRKDSQYFHDVICKTTLKPMPTTNTKT